MMNTNRDNTKQDVDDILLGLKLASSEEERRAILQRLMERRGHLRNTRERQHRARGERARLALQSAEDDTLREELSWFRDVVAIYRKLTEKDDPPRD